MKSAGDNAFTSRSPYGMRDEATSAGALSFLRRSYTRDLEGVDIAVTGIPFDLATTNRPGARLGPRAVRAASAQLSSGPPWPWGFDPTKRLAIVDTGDCALDHGRPAEIPACIERHAANILGAGASMLSIGGDHFITLPLLRAHANRYGPPRPGALRRPQRYMERRGWADRPRDDVLPRRPGRHRRHRPLGTDRDPDPQRRPPRIHLARRRVGPRARAGRDGGGDAADRRWRQGLPHGSTSTASTRPTHRGPGPR